ncbi:MAG: hypothetical protein NT033_00340, partial [Candidatus Omnitrophica bacterium]|nr:hypothetical protein [Candidatus Omnitrophota bacterium]
AYVTVEVYSSQNNIVRTLVNNQLLASGNHSHIFNGKSDLGDNLPEGRYTIKINAKAEAGNAGDPVYVNVSMLFISDIRISTDTINPYSGERASIIYQIGTDSILSIKIYDSANVLVRNLISNQSRAPGTYSEDWDGKDDSGQIVRDGPYYFIIEDIMSGSLIVVYDPRGTGGRDISHSISFSATNFNPLLNQFSILDYNMPQAAKINIKVRSQRFSGPAVKVIKYQEPVSRGSHQVLWDGRDEAGNFVDMKAYTFAIWGYTLDENSIVVTGGRPVISNLSLNLVRFSPYDNPYSLNISQNTISFNLSKNANVTINIYGSGGTLFRALLVNQLCVQGANSFIWDGKDSAGNLAIDDNYRVMMQAEKDGNYSEAYMLHSEICY